MFNFDTTYVINDLKTTDLVQSTDLVVIKRIANYKLGSVKDVSAVVPYVAPVQGSIDLAAFVGTAGKSVHLCFALGCTQHYAEFAQAAWKDFKKQYVIEFEGGDAAKLEAALKLVVDPEIGTVSGSKITFDEAGEIFAVKDSVKGIEIDADGVEAEMTGSAVIVDAKEAIGSYENLIRNEVFPTHENLRYNSPNSDALPIKGAKYDSIIVTMEVERENPNGGLSAVGQKVVSRTTQTYYVNQSSAVDAAALKTAIEAMKA